MNDIQFLEMVVRTMDNEPVQISTVKNTDTRKTEGQITMRVNSCDYTADTLPDILNMLRRDYSFHWLRHIQEKNEKEKKEAIIVSRASN